METLEQALERAIKHKNDGDLEQAERICNHILSISPDCPDAWHLKALVYQKNGNHNLAAQYFQRAIQACPKEILYRLNLGKLLTQIQAFNEAQSCFQDALNISPLNPIALNCLGNLHFSQGRFLEAEMSFRKALEHSPNMFEAQNNLGNTYRALGKNDGAIIWYKQALNLNPNLPETLNNLGNAYQTQGRTDEAKTCYRRAFDLKPTKTLQFLLATILPPIYRSLEDLEYHRNRVITNLTQMLNDGFNVDPVQTHMTTLFYLAYQGQSDREIHEMVARLCSPASRDLVNRQNTQPLQNKQKIRIGIASSYFRDHTVGHLWGKLVEKLARDRFFVIALSLSNSDDEITRQIRQSADKFIQLPKNLSQARQLIADENLDILFYTDIGMNPATYALAVSRLAPVQCLTWGHPVTSGLPTIDYFISSELLETEEADEHYTEKLVRLKTLGIYVLRPPSSSSEKTKKDFDLPEDMHLYGCLQSSFKLHPEFDAVLAEILRKDSHGLLLIGGAAQPHWNELLLDRFRSTMPDVIGRIHFLPRISYDDYMQLTRFVDALLIPPHFGGGRTSYEALSVGTPVVTLPSRLLRGRITFGLYQILEVFDCVAQTPEEYVDIAIRLGTEPDFRKDVHEKILSNSNRLFENIESVRELEQFFESVVVDRKSHKSDDHSI